MMQGVQNPELMFRSDPLPAEMRSRLLLLGYAPQAADLLLEGLPIVYDGVGLVVEYPSGERIQVERRKVYNAAGEFQRYAYHKIKDLPAALR